MGAAASQGQTLAPQASRQIQALQEEKASFTSAQQKMDSQLVFALKRHRGQVVARGMVEGMRTGTAVDGQGRVLVDIQARVTTGLLEAIAAEGGLVIRAWPKFNAIRVFAPLDSTEGIAALPEVRFMRPAVPAIAGKQDVEGVVVHEDDLARNAFPADGSGVKVGVLSSGSAYLDVAQTNGDLGLVTVLPGQAGLGTDGEGTAMLEVIHAMAPGAELFFATGEEGEAQFAQNILELRAAGCDIIVDDILYPDESPFQDGLIAQAVNAVTADGALYFSATANSGGYDHGTSATWEGDFADGGPAPAPVNGRGGRIHSFGALNYDTISRGGYDAVLFWSDPLGASTNDYDLYVLDSTGSNVVAASINVQNGSQDPLELIWTNTSAEERLVVVLASGAPRFLHLNTYAGYLSTATPGAIVGHAAATNAMAVAAANAGFSYPQPFSGGANDPVEWFCSDGPRHVFFEADGTPVTPGNFLSGGGVTRLKPELTAADGVSTSVPGPASDPFEFATFYGSSAAAPHAAAIAALLKSYNPGLTSAQVRDILTGTALPVSGLGYTLIGAGMDRDAGYGIVMAYQALASTPPGGTTATNQISLVLPPAPSGADIASLYSFTYGADGAVPNGLVLGPGGNLYGTTRYGGEAVANLSGVSIGYGTVFEVTTNGILTTLALFDDEHGASPFAGLIAGFDGALYGTTRFGGPSIDVDPSQFGYGTVFGVTTQGFLTPMGGFAATNGCNPQAALVQSSDGTFYGATALGGPFGNVDSIAGETGSSDTGLGLGYGSLFKLRSSGEITTLVLFGGTNGANPPAPPILGDDGNWYGVTAHGGAFGGGTVFKMTPAGGLTVLHHLSGGLDGGEPCAALAPAGQGVFLGTTYAGGAFGKGTVFQIGEDGAMATLASFDGTNGANPQAALVLGADGWFYGTTAYGGPADDGVVFRLNSNGAVTALAAFDGTNGANPQAGLTIGPDGNWYGTTAGGGVYGDGTVFRFSVAPGLAPPNFVSVSSSNTIITLTWTAIPGQSYQMRYTTNLVGTNWLALGGVVVATNTIARTTDSLGPGSDSQRFYQVALISLQNNTKRSIRNPGAKGR